LHLGHKISIPWNRATTLTSWPREVLESMLAVTAGSNQARQFLSVMNPRCVLRCLTKSHMANCKEASSEGSKCHDLSIHVCLQVLIRSFSIPCRTSKCNLLTTQREIHFKDFHRSVFKEGSFY
jgi:hypothetical protein